MLYCDETGFSKVSYKKRTFSKCNEPMTVNQLELNQDNITAIATVSSKRGLVCLKVTYESCDIDNF